VIWQGVGFGLHLRARSRKAKGGLRALLGKAPEAREVGTRLGWLARRMLKDAVLDVAPKRVTLQLHPAAAPVRIAVLPDGDLEVRGDTARIGPGYHTHVLATLAPLLEELEFVWAEPPGDPQAGILAWLVDELSSGADRIGMPADRTFVVDAPVLTAMGPRDAAWCEAVLADPARGADAFAWWDTGPGHAERARALLAMWLDVPWREPLDDLERKMMGQVDVDLAAAARANPDLPLPWAEWAELLELVGSHDTARIAQLLDRAGGAAPRIGYRRYPMEIELTGGWTVVLGGAFSGTWEDDGSRWWATDGDRLVELTSLTVDDARDSPTLLAIAPEHHPIVDRFVDGPRVGRAEAYDESGVRVVHGLVAQAPHVAILTCKGKRSDEAWALATWRSLRNDT
jgi:hypothetical protein